MISRKTLLVLGAGASQPFGFPTGAELRQAMAAGKANSVLLDNCGFPPADVEKFNIDFTRSGFSIDRFLAFRPEYSEIGKAAVAAILLGHEDDNRLHSASGPGGSDWYQSLWWRLAGGYDPEQLRENQLRVITFNYDRSLERYLHLTVQSAYGRSADESYELITPFVPHHVYGALGEYRAGEGDYRYGGGPAQVPAAAHGLKVIPSTRPDADPVCAENFRWAEQVFILGFGFDRMNCERLGFARESLKLQGQEIAPPEMHATAIGWSSHQLQGARDAIGGGNFISQTVTEAIEHWAPLLTAS